MDRGALNVIRYMLDKKYHVDTQPGHLNIVYIEGINPDFTLNNDAFDGWNDLCLIINHTAEGLPEIIFSAVCTTEPGKTATHDNAAKKLGGVARIKFGQYTAWRVGYHRRARLLDTHPALVQCAPILVHRDSNKDGKRTGDPITYAFGINQHSTSAIYNGQKIGRWSAGCLVRKWWADHLKFMELVKTDPRYIADKRFIFSSTIFAGDEFIKKTTI